MPLEYYFMLAGLVLLLIEFVVPGFGVFGVSGMVCLTVGGFYVLGGNAWAALVLLAVYLFLVLVITLLCVYLPKESKYNPFVLWTRQKNSEGYTGGDCRNPQAQRHKVKKNRYTGNSNDYCKATAENHTE